MKRTKNLNFKASIRGALLLLVLLIPFFQNTYQQTAQAAPETAEVANTAGGVCAAGQRCVFLPVVQQQAATSTDLAITGIEFNQAVQDDKNSVPLVANRPTVMRIYAQTGGVNQPLSNIKVQVTAIRSGNALTGLPQSYTTNVPLSASRAEIGSSLNLALPANWLTGTVDVTVRLDPDNTLAEANEQNNAMTKRLVFNNVAPLRIKIVPIRYTHTPNGRTYPAPTQDTISDWIRRTYPISQLEISWHSAYSFTGNLSTSDDYVKLLNEVTALKSSEGAPAAQVYYGLIPVSDGSSSWFSGGIAGVGWMSNRTSIGLNTAGSASQIAAHEIGHNMGMPHTPCGSAAGADANYPYSNGSIGQYGIDPYSGTLYNPAQNKDVMSYCDPKWVSDYTYKVLFQSQSQVAAAPELANQLSVGAEASSRSLLVRANITESGINLLPAYVLPGQRSEGSDSGEYRVQVLGMQDEVLADVPVTAYHQEMEGEERQGIHALIPLPDAPAAKVRLFSGDQLLGEQALQVISTDKLNGVLVEAEGDGYRIRWSAVDRLAIVRYTTDAGKTWTTLGVDQAGGTMHVSTAALPADGGTFDVVLSGAWK